MNNSLRPETHTRATKKCSACRLRKKKCSPQDRDWENGQQKCEFCEVHELPCGPNLKHSEDPAITQRYPLVPENEIVVGSNQARERPREHQDESAILITQNLPAPTPRRVLGESDGPPNPHRIEDGRQHFSTSSVTDLEEKANSKLHDFHALGNTLAYVSPPPLAYCHAHGAQQPYQDLSIEEKLHELFLHIYGIAVEAYEVNERHLARWILFALISALNQHPRILDSRKKNSLLKIAIMFQELGHQWDCEHILLKVAGMYRPCKVFSPEGPFRQLATSFSTSSMSIRRVLEDRWNETVGGSHADANLNISPLHTAVQHRQSSIIAALLSNLNDCIASQLTPTLTTSSNIAGLRVNIEERDLNGRTALFAAVVNGDESCCLALLVNNADANTRDDYGHTALEVAVRGGNFNIVKNLIEHHADVNPDVTHCSCLPLHAAIESGNFQSEIIYHLLKSGAKADLRRFADNKHAIDLAMDRGYYELAANMRHMVPMLSPTPFMLRDSSLGEIVP